MIRIPMNISQKNEVEQMYWAWFSKYHLKNFVNLLDNDIVMKKLILNNKNNLNRQIKEFLLADYNELESIKCRIDAVHKRGKNIKKETKEFLIARYKNYRYSQAAKEANTLKIIACPYCNQNYINVVYSSKNKIRLWGDLDHFFDKSTYPELAICLYNLIPVCKVCNQLKSSKKTRIVNPFNYSVNSNIKFTTDFDYKSDLNYLNGRSLNFNILIDEKSLSLADLDEIKTFDLENRYKQLKQNVQEIIFKTKAYDIIYQDKLQEKFGLNEKEIMSYIFGYTDNHLDRALSKFNFDIVQDLTNEE